MAKVAGDKRINNCMTAGINKKLAENNNTITN
jgi:hypothetical protein